jgi:uncharacterized membrane-anchored protein
MTGLSEKARLLIVVATGVGILVIVNAQIVTKQGIIETGNTVLLRLAPRDPRSLMQGDYMALRYAVADQVARAAEAAGVTDGRVVVKLAPDGEAEFLGLYEGQRLGQSQQILRFRRRGGAVRLASDAYFFEEGQWETFADARFGELRVDDNGDAVLIGLRDAGGSRLGPAAP